MGKSEENQDMLTHASILSLPLPFITLNHFSTLGHNTKRPNYTNSGSTPPIWKVKIICKETEFFENFPDFTGPTSIGLSGFAA